MRRRAFTLVELLLVMTILTVVIAVASPTLKGFFRGRTLDSEARRLLSLTRHGQSRAVFEGVPMLLWVDEKNRTYGLEEEPGYTDRDPKAVEFAVAEDLGVEPLRTPLYPSINTFTASGQAGNLGGSRVSGNNVVGFTERLTTAALRGRRANLPAIRFLPDGTFAQTSPQVLRVFDENGGELLIAQSRARLDYEIQSQTNRWDAVVR